MRYFLILSLLCGAGSGLADEVARVNLDRWLVTDPFPVAVPAFAESDSEDWSSLFGYTAMDVSHWRPRKAEGGSNSSAGEYLWKEATGQILEWRCGDAPAMSWAACYLTADRRLTATLTVQGSGMAEIYLEGECIGKTKLNGEKQHRFTQELSLRRGSHRLFVRSVATGLAHLEAWLETASSNRNAVTVTTNARFAPTDFAQSRLLDDLSSLCVSHDGARVAFVQSHRDKSGKKESWLEVRDSQSGKTQLVLRQAGVGNPAFHSDQDALLYTASEAEKTTLWRYDLRSNEHRRIQRGLPDLVKFEVSPDGRKIYYSTDGKEEDKEPDYQLIDELTDRLSDWSDHRQLFELDVESGIQRQLTATGDFALDEFALSREGNRLLFTRRVRKIERPYFTTEFWVLDPTTVRAERVTAQPIAFETAPANLTWLPGGRYVAYTSCAFLTDDSAAVHRSLSETDLWLLDLQTGKTRNLSGDRPWSVSEDSGSLFYNPLDRRLYVAVVKGAKRVLMSCDPLSPSPEFAVLTTPLPFVDGVALSADGRRLAFTASGPTTPEVLYRYDFSTKRASMIFNPHTAILGDLQLASMEPWNFVNQDGFTIEGRLFYPADFDPGRKWPLVVYYYAGVSPRDDRFTFTYHWWCANGYVVYVLNPVGAVGYGQAFADQHVNDWGTLATRDIIEGTDQLLKAHPFLDGNRMAAYGGSYGGFITLDLATKTDKFAALCSMSGISNITSYFGGGQWGFTYGDIALANSYPWNRRDVFVDKSPIFHADQVKTPLLLTHGSDDVNVPALESDQMFVALKLLGKEVALVRFKGEDHGFAKWSNRVAERELMLEWFDKHLKNEPEGWEHRWKK